MNKETTFFLCDTNATQPKINQTNKQRTTNTNKQTTNTVQMASEDIDVPVSSKNNCRFYENKYPEVEEFVLVKVKSVTEMGAYVELLEYNNIEGDIALIRLIRLIGLIGLIVWLNYFKSGMILSSEFSRRRIRSVSKLIRVGREEVVLVLRVDKEKGNVTNNVQTIVDFGCWLFNLMFCDSIEMNTTKATLICPSVVSLLRISSNAKRNTTNQKLCTALWDKCLRFVASPWNNFTFNSVGICTRSLVTPMMLSSMCSSEFCVVWCGVCVCVCVCWS